MGGLIEIASGIITQAERRLEITSQNISNSTTIGFKRRISFSELMQTSPGAMQQDVRIGQVSDLEQGSLTETGNPYDLAISGPGFFAVRANNGILYTRQGQFRRDGDGRLVTPQGYVLQDDGGGDLVLRGGALKILPDGVVVDGDTPVAKVAVMQAPPHAALKVVDGGLFDAGEIDMTSVEAPSVRQGMLEASNVSMGDEMVSMIATLRLAEAGQHLVTTYDDLMGRAISVFGQA